MRRVSWSGAALGAAAALFMWQASRSIAAAPSVSVVQNEISQDDANGIIFERQQHMLDLQANAETLGSIVAGEIPPDKLVATTRALADGAKESYESFKANVPGGRSKPEVWTNWADFSARMESFVRNSEALAKEAQTGNLTAVTSKLGDALPCKQCHDVYRAPKK